MSASRSPWPTALALGLLCLALGSATEAQSPAATAAGFDVEAATQAYLARVPAEVRARSDAYFEGGYWLLLWNCLWGLGVSWLILSRGWSAGMRERARRLTRFRFAQSGGNQTKAGRLLGLTERNLRYKLKKYNIKH